MDKIIFALLLFPSLCIGQSFATGVAVGVAATSANSSVRVKKVETFESALIEGVLICNAESETVDQARWRAGENFSGCVYGKKGMPIREFFDKNKPGREYEILSVVFSYEKDKFFIYYGRKGN